MCSIQYRFFCICIHMKKSHQSRNCDGDSWYAIMSCWWRLKMVEFGSHWIEQQFMMNFWSFLQVWIWIFFISQRLKNLLWVHRQLPKIKFVVPLGTQLRVSSWFGWYNNTCSSCQGKKDKGGKPINTWIIDRPWDTMPPVSQGWVPDCFRVFSWVGWLEMALSWDGMSCDPVFPSAERWTNHSQALQ